MCGIVGMISLAQGGLYGQDLEVFEQLLYVDALRGPDSTGAFCVQRNGQVQGFKHAAPPMATMQSNGWHDFRREAVQSGRIVIGHNRKATHGSINNENAHPFFEEHIVLVHNGTLWNHKQNLADRDVDSHAFAAALAQTAPEDVPQLIADVEGAYAFVWWDMNQRKLFFTRNEQRPLNIIAYNQKLVFASEAWMAMGCIQRNVKNLERDPKKAGHLQWWEVEPKLLHSIDLNGNDEFVELPAKKAKPTVLTPAARGTTTASTGTASTPATPSTKLEDNSRKIIEETVKRIEQQQKTQHEPRVPYFNNHPRVTQMHSAVTSKAGGFKVGEKIMVKIDKCQDLSGNGEHFFRVMGKVTQLGKPLWDFNGRLPSSVDVGDIQDWVGKVVSGRIISLHPDLAAGPSVMLSDLTKENSPIMAFSGTMYFSTEWEWIEENCKCKFCEKKLVPYERRVTNVKVAPNESSVEVICPDCIEERIQNAEAKEKFIQRRIAEMDAWQPGSTQSAIGSVGKAGGAGAPTLH